MNKKLSIIVITSLVMALVSCKSNETQITDVYKENVFSYNIEKCCAFTVENEILYASFPEENAIKSFDSSGTLLDTYVMNEGVHTNLSYYNNKLYCFTYGDDANYITVYDIEKNSLESHKVDMDILSTLSMTVANDNIYMVYWSEHIDEYLESVKYSDDDTYIYMGEKAVEIDTTDYSVNDVNIDNVLNLKPYSKNEIIYYAYDDTGGYYTTIYNVDTHKFADKNYNNAPQYTYSFDCYEGNIIYSDFNCKKISSVAINNPDVQIDFMANVICASGNDLKVENGKCYVLDNVSGNIFRTTYNDLVKENKEIVFYSSEVYSEVPYGCGYRINPSILKNEEFALNILAENSNYDICMMSSGQTISQNIRDRGAFYKLNDVPMVQEYLDKCFPYLKEAAYNDNGDIWMLPVAVDIPCIVYSPENCKKYGIDINETTSWQELIDICKSTYDKPELRDKFAMNGYQIQNDIMNHFNHYYSISNGKAEYDTELFRNICTMIKNADINSDYLHTHIIALDHYHDLNEYFNDYLFEYKNYLYDVFYKEAFSNLRAIATPSLNGEDKSCAECIFFCINPNSDNLNDTLNYLSTYCSYMLNRTDNYLLNNKSIYPFSDTSLAEDLFRIYSNATVHFTPSDEMFWQDYMKYQNDEISLDTMISEIERKTDMYLNE
jgi:hypothetical protein